MSEENRSREGESRMSPEELVQMMAREKEILEKPIATSTLEELREKKIALERRIAQIDKANSGLAGFEETGHDSESEQLLQATRKLAGNLRKEREDYDEDLVTVVNLIKTRETGAE